MCFTKPQTPQPSAQPAAPPAQGASSLVLGGADTEDERLRNAGVLGRLALRVGNFAGRLPNQGDSSGSSVGAIPGSSSGGTGGSSSSGGGGDFSGYGVGSTGGSGGGSSPGSGSIPVDIGRQTSK